MQAVDGLCGARGTRTKVLVDEPKVRVRSINWVWGCQSSTILDFAFFDLRLEKIDFAGVSGVM